MHGSFCALIKYITYVLKKSYLIFPITKGSVNTLMKLAGFSTSNKVKNHWSSQIQLYSIEPSHWYIIHVLCKLICLHIHIFLNTPVK